MNSDKRFLDLDEEVKNKIGEYFARTGKSPEYLILGWDDKNVIHTHCTFIERLRNKFHGLQLLIDEDSDSIRVY